MYGGFFIVFQLSSKSGWKPSKITSTNAQCNCTDYTFRSNMSLSFTPNKPITPGNPTGKKSARLILWRTAALKRTLTND
jgi:hypothetical protein